MEVFAPGKPIQPSLVSTCKATSHLREACQLIIDKTVKTCWLIHSKRQWRKKVF